MNSAKESRWKIFFGSRLFIVVAAVVAVLVIFGYARAAYQDFQVKQEIARLQEDAHGMEAKKLQLLEVLRYVKSDDFVEEKARTELNMIKPGEQVAVVTDSGQHGASGQEKKTVVKLDNIPNYLKWWNHFVHDDEDNY